MEALRQIENPLRRLHKRYGVPPHYYALLTADGDGIGHALSQQINFAQEKALVEALDNFAQDAWRIVEECRGFAFYVAADELCAYLPVDKALEASEKLAEMFEAKMMHGRNNGAALDPLPSLSVGIVIAHVKHDLRDIRHRAESALKGAKAQRKGHPNDGLKSWIQVNESVAGGTDRISIDLTEKYVPRMKQWLELLRSDDVSYSTAHGLIRQLDILKECNDAATLRSGLTLAIASPLLRRRRSGKGEEVPGPLASILDKAKQDLDKPEVILREVLAKLRGFAHELILASRILEVSQQRNRASSRPVEEQP